VKIPPRTLASGQRCQIWIHDVESRRSQLLLETDELLLEAPNWTLDGLDLVLNGAGTLWRVPTADPRLEPISISGVPPLNNDHVLDPDGQHILLSAYDDWQLYRAPLAGGTADRLTNQPEAEGLMHFLHGVSPDGERLAFVAIQLDDWVQDDNPLAAEIYTVGTDGAEYRQVTSSGAPSDGPEFSPDGEWLYYNTEAFSGHAQVARMRPDGSDPTRLTFSDSVDWFPHISPDGRAAVYLAYPPGTVGHPADVRVRLMLVTDGQWRDARPVADVFGGQGTINVNSWAPDSRRFAYVAYPID
jgi:TolB protein